MSEARNKFVRYIKEQLIGGEMKDNILLGEQPSARFFTGLLFPIMQEDISLGHP